MNFEKARKFSLIRQAVRQLDVAEDGMKNRVELQRIVVPAERERASHQDTPGLDTAEYWQNVFDVLAADKDSCGNELGAEDIEESKFEDPQDKELIRRN
ncbi:hypothetical protein GQ600_21081 [Phytophthora cactorum]|nr:hypothetical protein GQ600_21081 [Phytophthora cactorum]